jgi:isoamylase
VSTRDVTSGASAPLGATVLPGGVNFSVFSKHAVLLELLLFDDENATEPARIIPLEANRHRTYHYWHVFVPGLQPGQVYAYRAHGTFDPGRGLWFDAEKVLLDPYGLVVAVPGTYDRWAAARPGDNVAVAMKSVVADPDRYDWEGDRPLQRPFAETVIYELHVGGFTRHPSSGVAIDKRGTYAGLIEKIPYLKDLGVTAVELLPVFQFDAQDCPPGKTNYWGYCPRFVLRATPGVQLAEERARGPRRISRHGQSIPPRGPRGHPGRCIQSHNRRRPFRADLVLSQSGERHVLHPREG